MEDSVSFYEPEGHLIPIRLLKELLDSESYASTMRIFYQLLILTGCRLSEIDNMKKSQLHDNFIWWKLGKNQKEWRKEFLSDDFLAELAEYWKTHRTPQDQMLGIPATAARHRFVLRRPSLSVEWNETVEVIRKDCFSKAYRYQLKGCRKNFQSILFNHYWKKYNSPEIALEMVSKRMRHSSRKVTFYHYIENIEMLQKEISDLDKHLPHEWVQTSGQTRLYEFTT